MLKPPPALHETALQTMIQRLAEHAGVCPTHLAERPWCFTRQFTWTGTDAEWAELDTLMDRIEPDASRFQPTGQRCAGCGDELWCTQCYLDTIAHMHAPDGQMTPEDTTRYVTLAGLLVEKPA